MAGVVAQVPGGLPPSSQARPSSIQGSDVYGPWYLGGSTTLVGGTGGGGQIGGEGFGPPSSNNPVPIPPSGPLGSIGGVVGSPVGLVIAGLIGLAVWSYLEG